MIYFISGHRDLTLDEFNKIYVPRIEEVLLKDDNAEFIVGDCEGVDKFAMDYIFTNTARGLYICHIGKKPKHVPNESVYDERIKDYDVYLIGGFSSHVARDTYMTKNSDFDIAFVKDNRWNSGTAQNIKRRYGI